MEVKVEKNTERKNKKHKGSGGLSVSQNKLLHDNFKFKVPK